MSTKQIVVATMSIAAATVVAACGSSSTVAKTDIVKRADAVCASYEPKIRAIAPPPVNPAKLTRTDLPATAAFFGRRIAVERAELQSLGNIGTPDTSSATYRDTLSSFNSLIGELGTAQTAAQSGSVAGVETAIRNQEHDAVQVSLAIHKAGLKNCRVG